jgi:hypothetical protein
MTSRSRTLRILSVLTLLWMVGLSACATEAVEVTRITILERRVIERVVITVEVTRIHRVVETPTPTEDDRVPPLAGGTARASPVAPSATATVTPPGPGGTATLSAPPAAATATPVPSVIQGGELLLAAMKESEQTLLALQGALNSDPLPTGTVIELYDVLSGTPTFSNTEDTPELASIYRRYREGMNHVVEQGTDLYNHATKIQSGEAAQTEISPIHLALAQSATSDSTSGLQGLIRELEVYLASQP